MEGFTKITDDMLNDADGVLDLLDDLPSNVRSQFIGICGDREMLLLQSLVDCESPIEQQLALELDKVLESAEIPVLIENICIDNNREVCANGHNYRVDFLVSVKYWNGWKCYAVECDGHEFHQKTKEQVEKDNARQRDLQASGYTVIRFSGTEIYHKAYRCAMEVKRIIQAPAIKWLERAMKNEQDQR